MIKDLCKEKKRECDKNQKERETKNKPHRENIIEKSDQNTKKNHFFTAFLVFFFNL